MKRLKRGAALAVLAALTGAILWAAGRQAAPAADALPERPEDTRLEFWLGEDLTRVDLSGRDVMPGFGVESVFCPDYEAYEQAGGVRYDLTAYPDYIDGGRFVTRITVTDRTIDLWGLTVDASEADFRRTMEAMGFDVRTEAGGRYATKGRVCLSCDPGRELILSVEVTNREGIVF